VIDEVNAEIVKKIFELYADGHSIPSIARHLNKNNFLRNGKEWKESTLYDLSISARTSGIEEDAHLKVLEKR